MHKGGHYILLKISKTMTHKPVNEEGTHILGNTMKINNISTANKVSPSRLSMLFGKVYTHTM